MLGNFSYSNPTKLYFGDDAISFMGEELKNYGKKVMLTYGGSSIKKNGIYDIFNHICEQYFSGNDDNTSDYLAEALMKSVIHASRIAVKNPEDYEARSNLMWSATWALNTLIAKGKSTDWEVHMIGQAIGAYTEYKGTGCY